MCANLLKINSVWQITKWWIYECLLEMCTSFMDPNGHTDLKTYILRNIILRMKSPFSELQSGKEQHEHSSKTPVFVFFRRKSLVFVTVSCLADIMLASTLASMWSCVLMSQFQSHNRAIVERAAWVCWHT